MKYVQCFNELTGKISFIEVEDGVPFPVTNLADPGKFLSHSKESVEAICSMNNDDIAEGRLQVIQCKECEKFFIVNEEEIAWYKEKNLDIPKRCKECRNRRKAAAASKAE